MRGDPVGVHDLAGAPGCIEVNSNMELTSWPRMKIVAGLIVESS